MSRSLIYENMVPSWNAEKPRYMAYLRLILGMVDDMRSCLDSFLESFDLDLAVGAQLDILGSLVGVSRILPFAPLSASRELGDDDYRLLIRARIAQNTWDGTNESAARLFYNVFPSFGIVMEDGQDSSINVIIRGSFTDLQIEMINAGLLIPHPAGVSMTYEIPQTIITSTCIIRAGVYQAGQIGIYQAVGSGS